MRFQLGQTVFLAVLNTPLDTKGLPKRVQKLLPSQDPEPLLKATKERKSQTIARRANNGRFCKWRAAHISAAKGCSNPMAAKPSSEDTKQDKQEGSSCP